MHLTSKSAGWAVVLTWLFSICLCVPPLFLASEPIDYDYCRQNTSLLVTIYTALGAFYVPVVIILVAYGIIFAKLKAKALQKEQKMRRNLEMDTFKRLGNTVWYIFFLLGTLLKIFF